METTDGQKMLLTLVWALWLQFLHNFDDFFSSHEQAQHLWPTWCEGAGVWACPGQLLLCSRLVILELLQEQAEHNLPDVKELVYERAQASCCSAPGWSSLSSSRRRLNTWMAAPSMRIVSLPRSSSSHSLHDTEQLLTTQGLVARDSGRQCCGSGMFIPDPRS